MSYTDDIQLPDDLNDLPSDDQMVMLERAAARLKSPSIDFWKHIGSDYPLIEVKVWINGGCPTIRGTRIPVYTVVGRLLTNGLNSVLDDYPALNRDLVRMAANYAIAVLGG